MLRQANRRMYLLAFAMLAACSILVLSTPLLRAQAPAGTFLSFDAPGAGTGSAQGTVPIAINPNGVIVGYFVDGNGVQHGFIRDPDGTFTVVDFPGSSGTQVTAVNSKGLAVGSANLTTAAIGFLRYRSGAFKTLEAPGISVTVPVAMNDVSQVAGSVGLTFPFSRGFIWSPTQRFKVFKVPGAGPVIEVRALNSSGVITGSYRDALNKSIFHGFLRDGLGNYTSFDATDSAQETYGSAINASGQVTGSYVDSNVEILPFLRDADGTITLFAVGADQAAPGGINDNGVIVGTAYSGVPPYQNAFERDAAGNVSLLTLPFGTVPNRAVAINVSGQIAGFYTDPVNATHGWLMTP